MKRREFLTGTVGTLGIAGASIPLIGRAATPCPPPNVSVSGGTSATTACTTTTAEADWTTRSTAPGVVWAHDFRYKAEVDNFRFADVFGTALNIANSDGYVTWDQTDKITGNGCCLITIPTGVAIKSMWWRPFSPLVAGANGLPNADLAAGGALTLRTRDQTDPNSYNWKQGYYGHSSYASTGQFDGTDFYIQARVKISGNRLNIANPDGKLLYFDIPNGGSQEIIVKSGIYGAGTGGGYPTRYYMYTNFGSASNSFLTDPQGNGNQTVRSYQPGGVYDATATQAAISTNQEVPNGQAWGWPVDQWVTALWHITPGRNGINETGITVWVAKAGEKTYTKIWDKQDYSWSYDTPAGFNVVKFSGYMNQVAAVVGWTHKLGQIIFSKQPIPCPQA